MKILLYFSIIFIIAVSFILVTAGDPSPFIIPFSLVPIVIVGHIYGVLWAYLVSAILTAFYIGLTKLGLEVLPMLVNIINFNIAPLVIFRFNRLFKNHKENSKGRIVQAENDYQQLLLEDGQIKEFNAQLERDVLEMARLYEITKAMSQSMEFNGIFGILKNILAKTFKFSSGKIILISNGSQTEKPQIQIIYNIQSANAARGVFEDKKSIKLGAQTAAFLDNLAQADLYSEGDVVEPTDFDKNLVEFYHGQERKPLITKKDEGSFVAVGLFSQSKAIGILHIENIAEDQIDRFLIIASQFELELQKVKLYEMVQELAIMDGLTGMFVRRYLLERCQDELRRSIKHKLNLSCLIVDIDFFKDCNDRYGHLVGDTILKQIAFIIKQNIREVDFAGRYGGEEFCVILPDTPAAGAAHVAERLRQAVEQYTFKAYDESIKVTVSIGITVFPDDASDLNQLIDYADQAMYKAKGEGRNKVCTWR